MSCFVQMGKGHVVMIPYPVQGHVIPLMELAQCLAEQGLKVTFVNTQINHQLLLNALQGNDVFDFEHIHLVSIPDGVESEQDRNVPGKLSNAIYKVMPGKLEKLIREHNASEEDDQISCIIADQSLGWALEISKKLGIRGVAFLPAAAAVLVLGFSIPKLIHDGIIDQDGTPARKEILQLGAAMPRMDSCDFVWARVGNVAVQKVIFEAMVHNNRAVKLADWLICNSSYELEPGAFSLAPEIVPIGPLLASNRLGNSAGHFWIEDSTCLKWLDMQAPQSVIYVAFGSCAVFNQTQFEELARGLELTNKPFLWVVRPNTGGGSGSACTEGPVNRTAANGQMVGWAPQQRVLSHPSVACFISHCGWNSTLESVSNGVPILCWPYFADQFINQSYICDIWEVGIGFERDANGIISRGEIKNKVNKLLGTMSYKKRALQLKEVMLSGIKGGGSSHRNFTNFIKWLKA